MTKEEYATALGVLEKAHKQAKHSLAVDYALANSPAKIGDVIEDHLSIIRVADIHVDRTFSLPRCVYSGPRITRAGVEFKSGEKRNVYESNIRYINRKEYTRADR